MRISIKKVNKKMFEDFFSLLTDMAVYEKITPPDKSAKKRLMQDCIGKKPRYEAYLVQSNKKAIGFIILLTTYSSFRAMPTLYIEDIFIIEDFRRKGVGQSLFDFSVKLAKKRKCGSINWWTFNWNTPALNFYKKNKATAMDVTFFRYSL